MSVSLDLSIASPHVRRRCQGIFRRGHHRIRHCSQIGQADGRHQGDRRGTVPHSRYRRPRTSDCCAIPYRSSSEGRITITVVSSLHVVPQLRFASSVLWSCSLFSTADSYFCIGNCAIHCCVSASHGAGGMQWLRNSPGPRSVSIRRSRLRRVATLLNSTVALWRGLELELPSTCGMCFHCSRPSNILL